MLYWGSVYLCNSNMEVTVMRDLSGYCSGKLYQEGGLGHIQPTSCLYNNKNEQKPPIITPTTSLVRMFFWLPRLLVSWDLLVSNFPFYKCARLHRICSHPLASNQGSL